MGNQLVAVAPAQIFPVEHYMSDLSDLTFDTRFVHFPIKGPPPP